jgi:hypothetical protein
LGTGGDFKAPTGEGAERTEAAGAFVSFLLASTPLPKAKSLSIWRLSSSPSGKLVISGEGLAGIATAPSSESTALGSFLFKADFSPSPAS